MSIAARQNVDGIIQAVEPLRQSLLNHPIYGEMREIKHLRIFMQHHVFAVWDFMSLLKALQQRLTCVSVPWVPQQNQLACRLVNEIVMCEESDEDGKGGFTSHFDLYRSAMIACRADTAVVDSLIADLSTAGDWRAAVSSAAIADSVKEFILDTLNTAVHGETCEIAAAFTFGREDLLPDVFDQFVKELSEQGAGDLDQFKYYLQRHIEVDGDSHGPMALNMVEVLCRDDDRKWELATKAATRSLQSRLDLWDAIYKTIRNS